MSNKDIIIQAGLKRKIVYIKVIKKDDSATEKNYGSYSLITRITGEIIYFI